MRNIYFLAERANKDVLGDKRDKEYFLREIIGLAKKINTFS